MPFPKFPSSQELKEAEPITADDFALLRNPPEEPIWFNYPASKAIRYDIVAAPVVSALVLPLFFVSNANNGLPLMTPVTVYLIVDLALMSVSSIWGYLSVVRLIPEWMVVYIYYFVIVTAIRLVWMVVYYLVLFERFGLPQDTNRKLDQGTIDTIKYTSLAISTILPLGFAYWIVIRAFLPFRDYAMQVRNAVQEAKKNSLP